MIVVAVPVDGFQSHGRMVHVQHFELSIFIASVKNQLLVVYPFQCVGHDVLRLDVESFFVPPTVLQHDGLDLGCRIGYLQHAIVYLHVHLLMRSVDVDVCIGHHLHLDTSERFHDHEARRQDFLVVVVFVENREAIVPTHLQSASFVGYLQLIVGVERFRVD